MQASTVAPGVPRTLAESRVARVSDLRYELRATIPALVTEPVVAAEVIRFTLRDSSSALALDFSEPGSRISALSVNGKTVPVQAVNGHVLLPADALATGANEVRLAFRAGDGSLNRNPEYLYTLFVPARAHQAIPCFDQPDLKARWALALDVPAGWQALGNGAETSREESGGRVRLTFAETPPLPTYLFAFAAGRFSVETATRNGRTFRMFHRETDTAKVARNRDAIFDLHAAALSWLEQYTGIPYPWGKFDFLLVPSFQFGGMEHAGAIFYNASGLMLDQSATQNQLLGRASVIAHETAHMWFGDLVTMRWFDDVWMKEVFANFMAAKIVNPSFPAINHELRFLYSNYPAAYDVDRTPGTNAIRQPLDNLDDAGTLYGAIIYQKAPIVMRQLERILGDTPFRDGLREYLRGHSFGNATWSDLVTLLDARTPEDLAAWSHAWVDEPGRPAIETMMRVADGKVASLAFRQVDPIARRGLTWTQRLTVLVSSGGQVRMLPVTLAGTVTNVPGASGLPAPDFVLPTAEGIGYGGFVLDDGSRRYLLTHLPEITDPLTRGAAWVALWEEMLDGRVAPPALIDLSLRALPLETDELTIARILGYTEQAYWKFVDEPARARVTPDLERLLRAGLDRAATASLKSAWFSALRDTARSQPVLEWLERIWRKTETVPGLPFAEPDDITLALELAVREVPAWQEILDRQLARTENPDRKARFAFVRPALSPVQATRDAFFESLKDPANRRHEPWVLEGLGYLHHPLRAAASERYIAGSLGMLQEIQRTGDIFFPKRWADATLGRHSSPAAAAIVRGVLTALPADYPDRLRRVLLSSSDDLLRSQRGR
jgi:aminopeptidase N